MTDATEILLTALEPAKIQPNEILQVTQRHYTCICMTSILSGSMSVQLLIILENPLLGELSCHEVLKKLCRVLSSLNEDSREVDMVLIVTDARWLSI